MKKLITILFMSTMTMLLFSCSNKLTRDKAKELISSKFPEKVYSYIELKPNTYGYGDYQKNVNFDIDLFLQHKQEINNLKQANLIEINANPYAMFDAMTISISPEYTKYKKLEFNQGKFCVVELGEKVFVDITGIKESEGGKSAEVEYTWKLDNATPFSKALNSYYSFNINNGVQNMYDLRSYKFINQQTSSATAQFVKYDDGWRLENFYLPNMQ